MAFSVDYNWFYMFAGWDIYSAITFFAPDFLRWWPFVKTSSTTVSNYMIYMIYMIFNVKIQEGNFLERTFFPDFSLPYPTTNRTEVSEIQWFGNYMLIRWHLEKLNFINLPRTSKNNKVLEKIVGNFLRS